MGRALTIGVVAIKGGVGKTSVAANLAASLSTVFDKKTLVIDANFSAPNLGFHVGLLNPSNTLHDVLHDNVTPFDAIYQHPDGFHVMPGALSPKEVNPLKLDKALEPLRKYYDVIVLDSSPSLNDEMYATIAASDTLLVVSSPDYPTLTSTLHAINLAKKKNTPIKGIVLNKVRKRKFELTKDEIEKAAEAPILAIMNDDVNMLAALSQGSPVVSSYPTSKTAMQYNKLAAQLIGEAYEERGFFSQLKDSFAGMFTSKSGVMKGGNE